MHCDNCGGNLSHYLSVFESGTTTYTHRVGGNRKRLLRSTNAVQKSLEKAFSIAV